MKKYARCLVCAAWIAVAVSAPGCKSTKPTSPESEDYRRDTTPEHNGEWWIGGE